MRRPAYDRLYVNDGTGRFAVLRRFRFWPNGRVLCWVWGPDEDPKYARMGADDTRHALAGIYEVNGPDLIMEFTGFDESGKHFTGGVYHFDRDGSLVEGRERGPQFTTPPSRYVPSTASGFAKSPDW